MKEGKKRKLFRILWGFGLFALIVVSGLMGIRYGVYLNQSQDIRSLSNWLHGMVDAPTQVLSNIFSNKPVVKSFELLIDDPELEKIRSKRKDALEKGTLYTTSEDWVTATLIYKNDSMPAEVRLKGDMPDHWGGTSNWSFKVKLKKGATLFGMRRFAIQHPKTRNYMNEWILHRYLAHNRLMFLRYRFVEVIINGQRQKIYALEENFDRELILNNHRKEGVLFKFDSWYYWHPDQGVKDIFRGGAIVPYSEKKVLGSVALKIQFQKAVQMIEMFRSGTMKASEVFDMDHLGRFLAIQDIIGYYHMSNLDNLKFYYNPTSQLIEPVGYDNQTIAEVIDLIGFSRPFSINDTLTTYEDWLNQAFKDSLLMQSYVKHLDAISKETSISAFFEAIDTVMRKASEILQSDYPWYDVTRTSQYYGNCIDQMYENAKRVQGILHPEKAIHAYLQPAREGKNDYILNIRNIHGLPVIVVGWSTGSRKLNHIDPITLPAESDTAKYHVVQLSPGKNHSIAKKDIKELKIHYRLIGMNSVHDSEVYRWAAPVSGNSGSPN